MSQVPYENRLYLPSPRLAWYQTQIGSSFFMSCFPWDLTDFSMGIFFKCKMIYFNWRLVTLQYGSGFAIHWHELPQMYLCSPYLTTLPPTSPSHPSGSSQCTIPKHPVSFIKPGMVIHFTYDNTQVSMPFSKILPPLPSFTESKRLFYASVSLLLSYI